MSAPTKLQRAAWAETALLAFSKESRSNHEDSLGDLLADLMHWASLTGFDFDLALDRARMHYDAEA
jgi:hypothetical protein